MNRTQGGHSPARVSATIRRPDPADLAALTSFFAGLSMQTRVQRFFAPVWPTAALIRLTCGWAGDEQAGGDRPVDGSNPRSRTGYTDALVATIGGVIIGHAMAADGPADSSAGSSASPFPVPRGLATEFGVVVADAWQGQGVGSALVRALISRARARGVTSLRMEVLPGNREVLAMIAGHWTAARTYRGVDSVIIQAGLIPDGGGLIPDGAGLILDGAGLIPDGAGLALDQPARAHLAGAAA
jgi:GNAT superfamily N-acetyltransferase